MQFGKRTTYTLKDLLSSDVNEPAVEFLNLAHDAFNLALVFALYLT